MLGPIEIREIRVEVAGVFSAATAIGLEQKLAVTSRGNETIAFALPRDREYEVVSLE